MRDESGRSVMLGPQLGYFASPQLGLQGITIQETWLKPTIEFVIKGYHSIPRDREQWKGGGCIIFVKQEIQYRVLGKGRELDCLAVEIWTTEETFKVVNYCNPCKKNINGCTG